MYLNSLSTGVLFILVFLKFVSNCAVFYVVILQGLSFAFPIPSQYIDCCHDGEGFYSFLHTWLLVMPTLQLLISWFLLFYLTAELPLEFPDGTTPVTCRVSIYDSSSGKKVGVGSLMDKASAPPLPAGSLYMEEVHAKVWLLSSSVLLLVWVSWSSHFSIWPPFYFSSF